MSFPEFVILVIVSVFSQLPEHRIIKGEVPPLPSFFPSSSVIIGFLHAELCNKGQEGGERDIEMIVEGINASHPWDASSVP